VGELTRQMSCDHVVGVHYLRVGGGSKSARCTNHDEHADYVDARPIAGLEAVTSLQPSFRMCSSLCVRMSSLASML